MNVYSFFKITDSHLHMKDKNDKYQRILEAAVQVFAKNGFQQSTVSQIAKTAGVADGTIYLYFKSKDDILIQFWNLKAKQVFEKFRTEVEKGNSAAEKLNNLIHIHLTEFQQDRNMAMLYQIETHQLNRVAGEQIREISKMYLDIISEIVDQGQAEGSIRRDLYVGLVKRFIIGAVDEVISTWLHSETEYDLASMANPLVDLFIRGIGS